MRERAVGTRCAGCRFRELCVPRGLRGEQLARLDASISERRRVRTGEAVFAAGSKFHALFAVQSGSFKATVRARDGATRVIGFFMGGHVMGLDGIGADAYASTAVALEDSVVCVLPYAAVEALERALPMLQRRLHVLLSREIEREQSLAALLGGMRARKRLAIFLLDLSRRLLRRGLSASELRLRMTRDDIGSYLGVQPETVSRIFSQLEDARLVTVSHRHVGIRDMAGLQRILRRAD